MSLLDRFLLRATVTDVETVTPRMRRIRIAGESLRSLDWLPGQHIRVHVDAFSLRTYSVWDYADGEHLDLCVLDHPGHGPGARWSRQVSAGNTVAFTRPQGRLVLRDPARTTCSWGTRRPAQPSARCCGPYPPTLASTGSSTSTSRTTVRRSPASASCSGSTSVGLTTSSPHSASCACPPNPVSPTSRAKHATARQLAAT